MTTAFAHFVRGQLPSALRANICGAILAFATLLVGVWAWVSAIWGRYLIPPPRDRTLILIALCLVGIMLIDWGRRLWLN